MTRREQKSALRVVVDARIPFGEWGGIQQVVEGLARGFTELEGPEQYLFLVEPGGSEWLRPAVGENTEVREAPKGHGRTRIRRMYDASTRRLPALARAARGVASRLGARVMALPSSDGFVESLGADLVHFATPQAYLTDLPSVYQPHDLLHRHFSEQFSPVHARYRDHAYRTFCERASVVAVMTEFGRADLMRAYGLPAERVAVVPWAPVSGSSGTPLSGRPSALPADFPSRYVLYPAQTWPHKNHLRLLDALGSLRNRGIVIPLVCTGRQTDHFQAVQRRIDALSLGDQVWFSGYLAEADLASVLSGSTALVFPSLFEGWGLPVVEAFAQGIPVACSDSSSLPEVAGDAALLFDPAVEQALASSILRLWQDESLRNDLRRRGYRRAAELSWPRTALIFRAIYRHIAKRTLSEHDRRLLAPPTFPLASDVA